MFYICKGRGSHSTFLDRDVQGGAPKSGKRPTFGHKVDQKWGFCRRLSEGVRFKKSTFWVQKVHFWEVSHLSRFDPGYGPERRVL